MKVYLASDHAGFALKEYVKAVLIHEQYDVVDQGAFDYVPDDDYPDYIAKAAALVSKHPTDRAIIVGGSGQAEMMVANKFPHVRAALFYGPIVPQQAADINGRRSTDPYEMIRLTREHNDANVLSFGARFVTEEQAKHAALLWLTTPFSQDARHIRRLEKLERVTQ